MIEIRQREMRLHFNSQFTCGSCTFRLFLCIFQYDCVCAVGRPMSHKIIDTYVNEQKFSYQSLFAFVSFLVSFNERVLLAMLRNVRWWWWYDFVEIIKIILETYLTSFSVLWQFLWYIVCNCMGFVLKKEFCMRKLINDRNGTMKVQSRC